jgi:hypothetical protein
MKKYRVVRTLVETGEIQANSEEEAYEIADKNAIEDIKFIAQPFGFEVSQIKYDVLENY